MSLPGSHRLTILLFVTAMRESAGVAAAFPFPHKPPTPKSSRPPAAIPGPPVHADARVGDWFAYKSTGHRTPGNHDRYPAVKSLVASATR
jgi:hypothetical protein